MKTSIAFLCLAGMTASAVAQDADKSHPDKTPDKLPTIASKVDKLQKIGAYNMMAQLPDAERQRGVITYSSGNHGQAVAIAARALGVPAVVVMPTTAPAIKVEGARTFGAEVVFEGTTTLHRKARAERIAA